MKKIILLTITFFVYLTINAQKSSNILLGSWIIFKTISADSDHHLTQEESKQYVGDTISFSKAYIIAPKNKTFFGGCTSPNYQLKVVDAMKYYNNDRKYLKMIGCNTNVIEIVETSCGTPFASIHIISKNEIDIGVDNYRYFLKKIK